MSTSRRTTTDQLISQIRNTPIVASTGNPVPEEISPLIDSRNNRFYIPDELIATSIANLAEAEDTRIMEGMRTTASTAATGSTYTDNMSAADILRNMRSLNLPLIDRSILEDSNPYYRQRGMVPSDLASLESRVAAQSMNNIYQSNLCMEVPLGEPQEAVTFRSYVQEHAKATVELKNPNHSELLLSLIAAERSRCEAIEDPDERDNALTDLIDGAPEVVDRLKASMDAYVAASKGVKETLTNAERDFIERMREVFGRASPEHFQNMLKTLYPITMNATTDGPRNGLSRAQYVIKFDCVESSDRQVRFRDEVAYNPWAGESIGMLRNTFRHT